MINERHHAIALGNPLEDNMTESQNAQAIPASEPNSETPAQEDQAIGRAHSSQPPPDLPLPSGGNAGPDANVETHSSHGAHRATIGGDAEPDANALAHSSHVAHRATSSAKAEPIASDQPEPMQISRSATIPSSDGQTAIELANPIDGTRSAISSAQAEPIATAKPHSTLTARSATTPRRKPRAKESPVIDVAQVIVALLSENSGPAGSVSGHENREPQARPAADSNPPASNGGDGGHSHPEGHSARAAVNLPSGDGGASGHIADDSQNPPAARKPKRRHLPIENHMSDAAPGGDGDATVPSQATFAAHPVTALLIPMVRRHSQWHSAWLRLVLQGRAIGRGAAGGDKKAGSKLYDDAVAGTFAPEHTDLAVTLTPLIIATERLAIEIVPIDKAIEKIAKMHPLWPWAKEVYGIGPGSLGKIIAAAHSPALEDRDGNPRTPAFEISDYRSVAGLWKRFGLAVINGERQRMKSGIEGIEHAYAPRRRALMWNVGGGLIGFMKKGPRPLVGEDVDARDDLSPYQKLFVARLRYEAERDPAMRLPDVEKDGVAKESYKTHASNRARRYVEKRFLRDLYAAAKTVAGRGQVEGETQLESAAPSLPTAIFSGRGPYLVGDRGPELFVPESSKSRTEKQI